MRQISNELSKLLKSYIIDLRYPPVDLSVDELANRIAEATELTLNEVKGYLTAFFDLLSVIGASSYKEPGIVELEREIHATTARALCLAIQEGVSNLFDFSEDSEDVDNHYFGSWFLHQLEKQRQSNSAQIEESRVCEHVVVLVKARLHGEDAILLQNEGDRAWGKYKLIGGRVRKQDLGDPLRAAEREVKGEVQTKGAQASKIKLWPLSREPLEYSSLSERLGAYTLYRATVYECTLRVPEKCLEGSFIGEKGRVTSWFPIDEITPENEEISQKEVVRWIRENRWLESAKLSTKQPIRASSARLREFLNNHYNEDELRDLCIDLEVDYDDLPGSGKKGKVRELVGYFERRGRLSELEKAARERRPHIM
jgi:hypothetical protein